MPAKRKRGDGHSPAARPDVPRRSSRRIKEEADLKSESPYATKARESGENKTTTVWDTEEGVQQAVQQLSQMEEHLKGAVRRQRLAVESSDLGTGGQDPSDRPFARRRPNVDKGSVNELPADLPDEIEKAPMDDYEADLAMGDMAEAKAEDDKVDRGAKRPPAVNSAALPLPWKGRLGYVSTSKPDVAVHSSYDLVADFRARRVLIPTSEPRHHLSFRHAPVAWPPSLSTGTRCKIPLNPSTLPRTDQTRRSRPISSAA